VEGTVTRPAAAMPQSVGEKITPPAAISPPSAAAATAVRQARRTGRLAPYLPITRRQRSRGRSNPPPARLRWRLAAAQRPSLRPGATRALVQKERFAVAGHCRCASTIRGQFLYCATPQSHVNAGVGRSYALCIVRAMLSRIDSDPIHVTAGTPCREAKSQNSHETLLDLTFLLAVNDLIPNPINSCASGNGILALCHLPWSVMHKYSRELV